MRIYSLLLMYFTIFLIFSSFHHSFADEKIPEFTAPDTFDFLTLAPKTTKDVLDMSFSKSSIPVWLTVAATTGIFFAYDEEILREVQSWGRKAGLGNDDNTESMIEAGSLSLFRGPTDLGSALYFIGDGWTHFTIASSFLLTGAVYKDNRALQTGNQILHGMIMSTIPNQILKRSFGRESPNRSSKERGAWRPFPGFSEYNRNISKYDAMPTGHLMTATMTMTVIDSNYTEYRHIIRPAGFTLLTLLGLQMINNGVHWASDYPLGIAIGYVAGKVVSRHGRKRDDKKSDGLKEKLSFFPLYYHAEGKLILGLNINRSF